MRFGGALGGGLVGLLRPIAASRLGAMFVGVVGMFPVFLGMGILLYGSPLQWAAQRWVVASLASVIMGAAFGATTRYTPD